MNRPFRAAVAALAFATPAAPAEDPVPASDAVAAVAPPPPEIPIRLGPAYHLFAGLEVGRGLRFNNPYRLETELGSDARSLSLTATYLDVQVGAVLGGAGPVFHGVALHGSFALDGIRQEVLTPSYVCLVRSTSRFGLLARAGIPIVVRPDFNAGFEIAGGGIVYLTAGIGLTASLVGSLFYGAATLDTPRTAIPLLSFQAGAFYDFEVLP